MKLKGKETLGKAQCSKQLFHLFTLVIGQIDATINTRNAEEDINEEERRLKVLVTCREDIESHPLLMCLRM